MTGSIFGLLYDQARRIWYYRWLVIAVTVIVFTSAAAIIVRLPKVYESSAQIFVDKEPPVAAATQGVSLVGGSFGSGYVVQKTLLNDDNLHDLLFRFNPAARKFDQGKLANATAGLRGRIKIDPDQGDGFFQIHYQDNDPVRARDVVQALLDGFINANIARNRVELVDARRFLDKQIASYSVKVREAEAALTAFRAGHPGMVDAHNPLFVSNAVAAVASARAAYEAAAAQPQGQGHEDAEVESLRARVAALRAQYTDQYPDVVAGQHQLDSLLAARAAAPQPASDENMVAKAHDSLDAAEARLRSAEQSAADTPLDAQWADLKNNAEILRTNYQELLGRREAAEMSIALYGDRNSNKYQITSPPIVPPLPIGPNRRLYLALAAALAIAAGIAAAYLRAAIAGIFVAPRELEDTFGLPVAGTVSLERAWQTGSARPIALSHIAPALVITVAASLLDYGPPATVPSGGHSSEMSISHPVSQP